MGAPKLICKGCGYDVAGLPRHDQHVACPECGHVGPPMPEPVEWGAPAWVIGAIAVAAGSNMLLLAWSALTLAAGFAADGGPGAGLPVFVLGFAGLMLLSSMTLVAMMMPTAHRTRVLRLILTCVYGVSLVFAVVLGVSGIAGLRFAIGPLGAAAIVGHAVVSVVSLNVARFCPRARG